ncbi:MAG: hypothetical protein ACOX1Q_11035 [Eubacteriales bacterium]
MAPFKLKKLVPALGLAVVIAGSVFTYNKLWGNNDPTYTPPGYVADSADLGREDAIAPLLNQFRIDDKHYIMLSDDLREEYGLPAAVLENDIGEKLADIKVSPDESLLGCEVYRYTPAGGEAVVAVKNDGEYQLYRFFVFESYNNNQDEDAVRYLEIYGITKPEDISKIQFIGHSEQSKLQGKLDILGEITDKDAIVRFYDYYSELKNSSDEYFKKLFGFVDSNSGTVDVEIDIDVEIDPAAPDAPVSSGAVQGVVEAPDHIGYGEDMPLEQVPDETYYADDSISAIEKRKAEMASGDTPTAGETQTSDNVKPGLIDMGDVGSGSTEPSMGSARDALANPITIRIYHQSGVYYETVYYPTIGFISRHEVSDGFAEFMGDYINK